MIVVYECKPTKSHLVTLEVYSPKRDNGDRFLRAARLHLARLGKVGARTSYLIKSEAPKPARRVSRTRARRTRKGARRTTRRRR